VGESAELDLTCDCCFGSSNLGVRRRVLTLPEEDEGREKSDSCWR
jgi:hypothetical protein